MSLQLYNYLTRQREAFAPVHEGSVGMYVCGPTVYGHAHIGHAKAYITFDVLHRYLEYLGYKVRYVQNITDVGHLTGDADEGEDKIARQARVERVEPMEVVEYYTRSYFEDMDRLNILRPDISPRASGHVPEQIELAELLVEKGVAYESNGSVFFSVKDWPSYGKLSRRKIQDLEEGARVEVSPDKRDPRDFAIWRAATPDHIMRWRSPWGPGYPGWHAECSVMAHKYLGLPFDIHGGGLENIFPHNESEIAQSEAAYGTGFARYWVLNNMVTVDGYERLISPLYLVRQRLADAQAGEAADEEFTRVLQTYQARFLAAMDDDLNTPQALATLFDLNKAVNTLLNSGERVSGRTWAAVDEVYRTLGGDILGLIPDELPQQAGTGLDEALMRILIDLRAQARKDKDWATADMIRDRLAEVGVALEDRPEETTWQWTEGP
jgi:cysteinyl-tRNA synthetase